MTQEKPTKQIIYLSKGDSGLPFDIVKDNHFPNYMAKHENGMLEELKPSDIINAQILKRLKDFIYLNSQQ